VSQTEHFDAVAERYDALRVPPGLTILHDTLVREGDLAGRRVLDIGCGTGAALAVLEQQFQCKVSGVDPSAGMLDQALRKLPQADLRQGVAEDLPFRDESFDAALMMTVVQHVDRRRAFPETRRVLANGGRFVIATPDPAMFPHAWMAPLFPSYVEIEQRRFPAAQTMEEELDGAGFAAVRCVSLSVQRRFDREHALERLRRRYASTFDHMSDAEYREGLARAERDLPDPVEYQLDWLIVVAHR
jgi:ubiquinone/menaquinone biosynthesis C-methylase UbiE